MYEESGICGDLPGEPLQPWYEIEMLVTAKQRQRVLARQSRDPKVISRNRTPNAPKFLTDLRVSLDRCLIHRQQPVTRDVLGQPPFIPHPVARLADSVTVFAKRNHWHCDAGRSPKDGFQCQISVR